MSRRFFFIRGIAVGTLSLLGLWGCLQFAEAGPITGTKSNPPTKLAVYQGVISIIPGAGNSIMEIGNLGKEIISTGTINLRPQKLVAADGAQIVRTAAGKTDLKIPGRVCINGSCQSQWPVPSGTSLWTTSGTDLFPLTNTHGIYSAGSNLSNVPTLDIFGNHAEAALYIKNNNLTYTSDTTLASNAYALISEGSLWIQGNLDVTGKVTMIENPGTGPVTGTVWHAGNDGLNSGLDADYLDSIDFSFDRSPSVGAACAPGSPAGQFCICATFYTSSGCLNLN